MNIAKRIIGKLVCGALVFVFTAQISFAQYRFTLFVDPFVGVDGGGNTVPGAGIPFGFVRLSPDTEKHDTNGYSSNEKIKGFSHTHVSGTGGASKYGNFLVTPQAGEIDLKNLGSGKDDETAAPGFYSVLLTKDRIKAELTATGLAGVHRYTFPDTDKAHILIDLASVITPAAFGADHPKRQRPLECAVNIVGQRRVEGTADFVGGWNPMPYTLHFAAEFDRDFAEFGTWRGSAVKKGSRADGGRNVGAWARFDARENRTVRLKLAVSFESVEQARANLEREMPNFDFDETRRQAQNLWENALAKIEVAGGSADERRIFYTALYHAQFMPHDLSADSPAAVRRARYEDFYCIWDTFRTLHPLLTVIQPARQREMINSLLRIYDETGWIPDGRISGANGMTQGGSNADIVLADAIVKDLGGFDAQKAYAAMRKNAETESPRPLYEGRVLEDYKRLGYVSMNQPRSASRTMEYAFNDFCIALAARKLGKTADYRKYLARSRNWRNLWDKETRSVRPRHANGAFLEPFTAAMEFPNEKFGFWDAPFYEGSGWQYSTFVPHDVKGLIDLVGGAEKFVAWLDEFFDGKHYTHVNEPDILAAYLYVHAGRHDKTAARVRQILRDEYKTGRAGLPGNDDAGAISSWYVWSAVGLYPNAGQDFYYIGSPVFAETKIKLENNREFVVTANNAAPQNQFVRAATLNGKPLDRAFLRHAEIVRGGRLVLEMSDKPGEWTPNAAP